LDGEFSTNQKPTKKTKNLSRYYLDIYIYSFLKYLDIRYLSKGFTGVRGYGPLIGAVVGNSLSDGIAAAPEGKMAAAGALAGSFTPCIPPLITLMLRVPLESLYEVYLKEEQKCLVGHLHYLQ
jgi:hypothetical protein